VTAPAGEQAPYSDLIPRPDPTKLTAEALSLATAQFRRDLQYQREFLDLQISGLKELTLARFAAAEQAVETANEANEKRLDSVNEFRAQQTELIAGFLSRTEYEGKHAALVDATEQLRKRVEALAAVTVPRLETDAWRQALTDKFETASARNTEAITALSSRLDRGEGGSSAAAATRNERRAEVAALTGTIMPFLVTASIIVAVVAVVISLRK
jgi:hypothetical protein